MTEITKPTTTRPTMLSGNQETEQQPSTTHDNMKTPPRWHDHLVYTGREHDGTVKLYIWVAQDNTSFHICHSYYSTVQQPRVVTTRQYSPQDRIQELGCFQSICVHPYLLGPSCSASSYTPTSPGSSLQCVGTDISFPFGPTSWRFMDP